MKHPITTEMRKGKLSSEKQQDNIPVELTKRPDIGQGTQPTNAKKRREISNSA